MTSTELSTIFSVGSIALGVLAWLMSIWAIGKYKPWKPTFSYFFCAAALLLQLLEVWNRVRADDYAAIEDTVGAIAIAGIFMMAVTVILNLVAYFKFKDTERKAKKEALK